MSFDVSERIHQAIESLTDPITGSPPRGKTVRGIICLHVDDLFCSGNQEFYQGVISLMQKDCQTGSEDTSDILFVGQRVCWSSPVAGIQYLGSLVILLRLLVGLTFNFVGFLQQIKESEEPSALYIYSKADKLISATNIAKHIAEKRVRFPNAYLKSHVYEDAEHTMIYMKYPESYLSHIKEHLNVCQLNLEGFLHENAKVTKAKL